LKHNIDDFRALEEGGAHNALSLGTDIANSVTATTCLPTDEFVRATGGKFYLGGRDKERSCFPSSFETPFYFIFPLPAFLLNLINTYS